MERKYRASQKVKSKLAKRCQRCKRKEAIVVRYVKWYSGAMLGSYNERWASLCIDCNNELAMAFDILPEPRR